MGADAGETRKRSYEAVFPTWPRLVSRGGQTIVIRMRGIDCLCFVTLSYWVVGMEEGKKGKYWNGYWIQSVSGGEGENIILLAAG